MQHAFQEEDKAKRLQESSLPMSSQSPLQVSEVRKEAAVTSQHCTVVGMSLRYPGKAGMHGFWQAAVGSTDVQQQVPLSRWNNDAVYSPDIRPGKLTVSTR